MQPAATYSRMEMSDGLLEREDHYIKLQPAVVADRCVLLNWFIDCFIH